MAAASWASETRTFPAASCCLSLAALMARAAEATSDCIFFNAGDAKSPADPLNALFMSFPSDEPVFDPTPWKAREKMLLPSLPEAWISLETMERNPVITGKMLTCPEPTSAPAEPAISTPYIRFRERA
ncbi:hypothetical protein [Bifidobacterium crudilactis]|uniref:hypothetical protein n=1 Tax=Bifidobacterium crudilactis TaxID=327277 RepID=UPI002648BAAB|nr:hypothetical protein [Bifidobacterium crudilactis]MDN6559549.1 hypothetical protein [Bifidobacterium crudilactis]MDN6831989.1 hypothetical protein [Bifidobacterium crudilactis]